MCYTLASEEAALKELIRKKFDTKSSVYLAGAGGYRLTLSARQRVGITVTLAGQAWAPRTATGSSHPLGRYPVSSQIKNPTF